MQRELRQERQRRGYHLGYRSLGSIDHGSCRALRKFHNANLVITFSDFQFGNARLGYQIDQGFEFSKIHAYFPQRRTSH